MHWMGAETSWADGDLCLECYGDKIVDIHNECVDDNKKRKKRLIISCITYILGLICIFTGVYAISIGDSITEIAVIMGIGVILCGVYTGLTWHKAAVEEHEDYERKHGVTYTIDENGIHRDNGIILKIIFFIIAVCLGLIWTPIRIIIDAVNYKKDKKTIQNCSNILTRISSM